MSRITAQLLSQISWITTHILNTDSDTDTDTDTDTNIDYMSRIATYILKMLGILTRVCGMRVCRYILGEFVHELFLFVFLSCIFWKCWACGLVCACKRIVGKICAYIFLLYVFFFS